MTQRMESPRLRLGVLGISIGAFRIAGGMLLFSFVVLLTLNWVQARQGRP